MTERGVARLRGAARLSRPSSRGGRRGSEAQAQRFAVGGGATARGGSGAERSGRGRRPAAGRSGEPSRAGVSRPGSHGRGGGGEVNRAQALASRWLRGAERGPSVRGGAETRWYPRPAPSLLPSLRPGPSRCLRSTARAASPSPPPPPPLPLLRPAGTRAGAAGDGRSGPVDEQRPEGQISGCLRGGSKAHL